jgi:HAD superfamily hydrolase (TIGR01509 family)
VTAARPAAVVFDFDGLVLDTEWCEYATVAEVFAAHGEELPLELWLGFIGTTDHPHWADILEDRLGRPIDRAAWVPARRLANRACTAGLEVLPGVLELFDALAGAGVPLAVASSSPADWVVGHLRERGLLDRFVAVCSGDEVLRTKPDPALYVLACERLGVDPAGAVAVEDSVHGVRAARAAGMAAVAVPSSLTAGMDFSDADLVVDSCAALDPAVLGRVVAERRRRIGP